MFIKAIYDVYLKKECFLSDLVNLHTPEMFQNSVKLDFEEFLDGVVLEQHCIVATICSLLVRFFSLSLYAYTKCFVIFGNMTNCPSIQLKITSHRYTHMLFFFCDKNNASQRIRYSCYMYLKVT